MTLLVAPWVYEPGAVDPRVGVFVAVVVLGSASFHGLNGLRLLLGDAGILWNRRQHKVAIIIVALMTAAIVVSAVIRELQKPGT
jgi:succinate dehydrogenase/fumarate reductase cytochrome b subunit